VHALVAINHTARHLPAIEPAHETPFPSFSPSPPSAQRVYIIYRARALKIFCINVTVHLHPFNLLHERDREIEIEIEIEREREARAAVRAGCGEKFAGVTNSSAQMKSALFRGGVPRRPRMRRAGNFHRPEAALPKRRGTVSRDTLFSRARVSSARRCRARSNSAVLLPRASSRGTRKRAGQKLASDARQQSRIGAAGNLQRRSCFASR